MMKKFAGIAFLASVFVYFSCGMGPEKRIQGLWKAKYVTEGSDTLNIDLSTTQLTFKPDGQYAYSGNLNYRESGVFHIKGHYLYTTDDSTKKEKAVEILLLEADTLILHMEENTLDRVMRLERE